MESYCMLLSRKYNEQKYHPYESFAYTAVVTVARATADCPSFSQQLLILIL